MTIKCKPVPYKFDPEDDLTDVVSQYNSTSLNDNILKILMEEFYTINNTDPAQMGFARGDEISIPVLLPFVKQHESGKFTLKKKTYESTPPVEVERTVASGTKNYRTYPYLFSRPGDTIKAVIRLYNDMSLDEKMIGWLLNEFNEINRDALPPRLGQCVQIPVLLPFCFRHENNNKIFKNS